MSDVSLEKLLEEYAAAPAPELMERLVEGYLPLSRAIARRFAALFDLPVADNPKSTFAGTLVEASKGTLPGTHGHIGVGTLNVRRAMHFLESRGVGFREDYRSYDKAGNLVAAYITEEIGGFAVHVVKRA